MVEKGMLLENVAAWSERIGDRLNDLPDEERRELLQSLLDRVTIDRDNNLNLTLAVPTEEFVSIKRLVSGSGSWDGFGASAEHMQTEAERIRPNP